MLKVEYGVPGSYNDGLCLSMWLVQSFQESVTVMISKKHG
jgi:hypothetical protein